jgi:hypothetical protein
MDLRLASIQYHFLVNRTSVYFPTTDSRRGWSSHPKPVSQSSAN